MDDLFCKSRIPPSPVDADQWLDHLFSSQAAIRGGVVRRKAFDVERIIGLRRFRAELRRRGYSAVRNGGQIVIFCNAEPIRPL